MSFDALAYFEKLKSVGFTDEQARLQADTLRMQSEEQRAAIRAEMARYDDSNQDKLASKADIRDVKSYIRSVEDQIVLNRVEIEKVRGEMQRIKYELLKWQPGGWVALAAIMAKGFGWLGF